MSKTDSTEQPVYFVLLLCWTPVMCHLTVITEKQCWLWCLLEGFKNKYFTGMCSWESTTILNYFGHTLEFWKNVESILCDS
uniref:Uncharacterized protein n=1 Tax=Anguilla anguilla TaxID=7936 RepID=A0A0E9XK55_ANGAN